MSDTSSILTRRGQTHGIWPVLLLVLAAILIPTTCILWFMNAAMNNEQLAVRQRLVDVYSEQLDTVRQNLNDDLAHRAKAIAEITSRRPPIIFSQAVFSHAADSLLVLNPDGTLAYPLISASSSTDFLLPAAWDATQQLELTNPAAAAARWGVIAHAAKDSNWMAAAFRNQARALANAHQIADAIKIFSSELQSNLFLASTDPTNPSPDLLAPAALLRALQLRLHFPQAGGDLSTPQLITQTRDWLERYDAPLIPSSQRLFLLHEFQNATGETSPFLTAEQLAIPFAEDPAHNPLPPTDKPGLYKIPSQSCYALITLHAPIILLRPQTLDDILKAAIAKSSPAKNIQIELRPNTDAPLKDAFLDIPAGDLLPAFRLTLSLNGPNPFAAASARQRSAYIAAASTGIAAITALGLLLSLYLTHQLRLTRLKNDLIATVSHELKTPLSSMRLLIDTLLLHRTSSPEQAHEYLTLVARENLRLSRLIDNFLTFSRMERHRHRFTFASTSIADIIHDSLAAVPERAPAITAMLPPEEDPLLIHADREPMVTLLTNLLDNAWKYSNEPRRIHIRARRTHNHIELSISDNGIGIPRHHHKKIFHRFYQIDQSLSRKVGGTGLGLAIVHFIASAHHAPISLESTPAKGTTFTLAFPTDF